MIHYRRTFPAKSVSEHCTDQVRQRNKELSKTQWTEASDFFFFFLLAAAVANGSSQARDWIQAVAEAYIIETPDP